VAPESKHLTDEQFAECLTGEMPSAATREHLAVCEACRAEMDMFTSSVKGFDAATMDWSRMRPAPKLSGKTSERRASVAAPLGWALATAFALVIGVPVVMHQVSPATTATQTSPSTALDDSAAQIAQDNKLMASVDVVLNDDEPSPFREYHIADPAARRTKPGAEAKNP
jgi:predicted anti-sigma-YlaC factor YlaD